MAKPILNNFLLCMSLETGGKIIGYLAMIFGIPGILLTIYGVIIAGLGFKDIQNINDDHQATYIFFRVLLVIASLLSVAYMSWMALSGFYLLIGIKRRFHKNLLWILILFGFDTIVNFFAFIFFTVNYIEFYYRILNSALSYGFLVFVILDVYCFVIVLSLKRKIQAENVKPDASAPPFDIIEPV